MKLTDQDLADFIRVSMALRLDAIGEKRARLQQSKITKQRAEISRLHTELTRVKQLADSRGKLLLDIQARAMRKQVEGDA